MKKIICICIICSLFLAHSSYSANQKTDKDAFKDLSYLIVIGFSGNGNIALLRDEISKRVRFLLTKYPKSPYTYATKYIFLKNKTALEEGFKKYPKVPEILFCLADASNLKKTYKKSIEYYKQALKYKSKMLYDKFSSLCHYLLGNCYRFIKKYDEALIEYNKTIKIYPKFARALINIGFIYRSVYNKPDKALTYLKKAVKINSKIVQAHVNIVHVYLYKTTKIYNRLTPEQKKVACPRMDKYLMKAWTTCLNIIKLSPENKQVGYSFLRIIYSQMCPSLRATMYSMGISYGIHPPNTRHQSR